MQLDPLFWDNVKKNVNQLQKQKPDIVKKPPQQLQAESGNQLPDKNKKRSKSLPSRPRPNFQ